MLESYSSIRSLAVCQVKIDDAEQEAANEPNRKKKKDRSG